MVSGSPWEWLDFHIYWNNRLLFYCILLAHMPGHPMVVRGHSCLSSAFILPRTRCSTKGQPTRLLGNESAEIGLQTNATYHAELQVYRVNSTLQLHRVDEPLLLRCTVQNFLGTNSQDITLVPHGEN